MHNVFIVGIGQTPVGEHWGVSLRNLAVQAIQQAIQDSNGMKPGALFVANTLGPNLSRQANLGALLVDYAGLTGIEATTFELGGASGGAALRQAALSVECGFIETALVIGVEKFTDATAPDHETAALTQTDSEYEAVHGLTPSAQAALLAKRYLHEFNLPPDCLAGFPLQAHANAQRNKHAFFHRAISLDDYLKAETSVPPLNRFDIAPYVDGAAAILLTRGDLLPESGHGVPIQLVASTSASDSLALHDRFDLLTFEAARRSAETALQAAQLAPEQIDLFEYFDAWSIFAALTLEAAGFAPRGQGWKLASAEGIARTGQIPCATFGGLLARGNPLGATGVYQVVEAVLQLRGQAGACQVEGARTAMVQCLSGPASTSVTHILERVKE